VKSNHTRHTQKLLDHLQDDPNNLDDILATKGVRSARRNRWGTWVINEEFYLRKDLTWTTTYARTKSYKWNGDVIAFVNEYINGITTKYRRKPRYIRTPDKVSS